MLAASTNSLQTSENMLLNSDFVVNAVKGELLAGSAAANFAGVSTDSRSLEANELFIALAGENFDGHDFVQAMLEQNAAGAVVDAHKASRWVELAKELNKVLVAVPDSLTALGDLAHAWRKQMSARIVAVTGSSGKTGTRNMIAAILSRGFNVLVPQANYNNLIGLPLTLLRLQPDHEAAVLELGMNQRGEIARLTEICEPDVALITNVGPAHIEFFESIDEIAEEKGDLFFNISDAAIAAVNLDDSRVAAKANRIKNLRINYGIRSPEADIRARDISGEGVEGMRFTLNIRGNERPAAIRSIGEHSVLNAVAAAAAATALNIEIEDICAGLSSYRPASMRLQYESLDSGLNIINDTYNANPDSVKAAVKTLKSLSGNAGSIAILGDMRELGSKSEELHREIGEYVAETGTNYLFVIGEWAAVMAEGAIDYGMPPDNVKLFHDNDSLVDTIKEVCRTGDWVLVKGSRLARMEIIVDLLKGQERV